MGVEILNSLVDQPRALQLTIIRARHPNCKFDGLITLALLLDEKGLSAAYSVRSRPISNLVQGHSVLALFENHFSACPSQQGTG